MEEYRGKYIAEVKLKKHVSIRDGAVCPKTININNYTVYTVILLH
jgi:hypothetical protein